MRPDMVRFSLGLSSYKIRITIGNASRVRVAWLIPRDHYRAQVIQVTMQGQQTNMGANKYCIYLNECLHVATRERLCWFDRWSKISNFPSLGETNSLYKFISHNSLNITNLAEFKLVKPTSNRYCHATENIMIFLLRLILELHKLSECYNWPNMKFFIIRYVLMWDVPNMWCAEELSGIKSRLKRAFWECCLSLSVNITRSSWFPPTFQEGQSASIGGHWMFGKFVLVHPMPLPLLL